MYKIWMKLRNDEREKHRQFMSIMIFFAFLLLRGKTFDLMVCSSSHCLNEPIYNDARINAKSKTHKNRNRASASDEREQLDVGLLFFLFHFLLLYISVKIRVSNARSTLFTNTKPVYYYYNVPILKSGIFFLFAHTSAISYNPADCYHIIYIEMHAQRKVG